MKTIYKLVEASGGIRYIGITKKSLSVRLTQHLSEARRSGLSTHRLNWLRSLTQPPAIEAIELVSPDVAEASEIYWISLARDYGCELVNTTDGGDGVKDVSGEVRAKISASLCGRKLSLESRGRMSEAAKRRVRVPYTPEHCAAISAAKKGRPISPITRAAQLRAITGKQHSPEHREAIRAGLAGKPKSTEHRASLKAAWITRRGKT